MREVILYWQHLTGTAMSEAINSYKQEKFSGKLILKDRSFIYKEIYLLNGLYHRTDGAAVMYHDDKTENIFSLNGRVYHKEDWFQALSEDEKIQALWNIEQW